MGGPGGEDIYDINIIMHDVIVYSIYILFHSLRRIFIIYINF